MKVNYSINKIHYTKYRKVAKLPKRSCYGNVFYSPRKYSIYGRKQGGIFVSYICSKYSYFYLYF